MRKYYGDEVVCPVYIQVEDGERLSRALKREREQANPKYEEMCRRIFWMQGYGNVFRIQISTNV